MKVKEPLMSRAAYGNQAIPHLRNYIIDKVETEQDVAKLEQIYAIISAQDASYRHKFQLAKEQTEKYCPTELAEQLEEEGYMIGKPFPCDDSEFDFDAAIREDAEDETAPREWVQKMFPELNVRG